MSLAKTQSSGLEAHSGAFSIRRGQRAVFILFGAVLLTMLASKYGAATIPGDFNGDGVVNSLDLAIMRKDWNPDKDTPGSDDNWGYSYQDFQTLIDNYTFGTTIGGSGSGGQVNLYQLSKPATIAGYTEYDIYAQSSYSIRATEFYFSGQMFHCWHGGTLSPIDACDSNGQPTLSEDDSHVYAPSCGGGVDPGIYSTDCFGNDGGTFPEGIIPGTYSKSLVPGYHTALGNELGTATDPFVLGFPNDQLGPNSPNLICLAHLVLPNGDNESTYFTGSVAVYDGAEGEDFKRRRSQSAESARPEPLTMVAIGMGIAGLGGYIRRRHAAAK